MIENCSSFPASHLPKQNHIVVDAKNRRKKLIPAELNEHRAKGLCYISNGRHEPRNKYEPRTQSIRRRTGSTRGNSCDGRGISFKPKLWGWMRQIMKLWDRL